MVDVGASRNFRDGEIRIVIAGSHEVGIICWRDEWFAVRNVCPHRGAPVCLSGVHPTLVQGEGYDAQDVGADDSEPVIVCPWHKWEFAVRSGKALTGTERLKTYPVIVDDGRVLVDTEPRSASSRRR